MLFDRQVRKLGRDFVEMKGPDISLVMDFSGRGLNLITDAAFLRDLLSDQAFPFRMTLEARGSPEEAIRKSGFLMGKGIRLLSAKRKSGEAADVLHAEGDSVVSLSADLKKSGSPLGIEFLGSVENAMETDIFFSGLSEGMGGKLELFAKGKEIKTKTISDAFGKLITGILGRPK